MIVTSKSRKLISTDISIALPENSYGQIAARSGLSMKGIDIGAGVIDRDYLGVIKVLIINNSDENFNIKTGMRIAQLLCLPIIFPNTVVITELCRSSTRGCNGFGSTGV